MSVSIIVLIISIIIIASVIRKKKEAESSAVEEKKTTSEPNSYERLKVGLEYGTKPVVKPIVKDHTNHPIKVIYSLVKSDEGWICSNCEAENHRSAEYCCVCSKTRA